MFFGEPSVFNPADSDTSLHIYNAGSVTKEQLQELERAACGGVAVRQKRSIRKRSLTRRTKSKL